MTRHLLAGALLLLAPGAWAADTLPPPPQAYFNDYASLVSTRTAQALDQKLRDFDARTSNQVLVVLFPELPSASLEDFTIRTAQSWRVGQKKLDNGVILFVFVKDRKLRMEVGYGLEGALPDALAARIIADTIAPAFKKGAYDQGLTDGVAAIMAATQGEYQAPRGRRATSTRTSGGGIVVGIVALMLLNFVVSRLFPRRRVLRRSGAFWWGGGSGRGGGGGGWGGRSSGGGGFSGGGGSFGGGGASGNW